MKSTVNDLDTYGRWNTQIVASLPHRHVARKIAVIEDRLV